MHVAYVLLPWISVSTRKCTEVSAFCSVICRSSVNKQVKSSSISFFFKSLVAKLKLQKIYRTPYFSKIIQDCFQETAFWKQWVVRKISENLSVLYIYNMSLS